jgi:uncharacterized protein involved in type VI secretion and phage assembly
VTAPAMTAIAPEILVNGSQMSSSYELSGLRIRTSFGLPGRATLRFDDSGFAIAAGSTFTIGTQLEVRMADGGTLFAGEVTGIDLQLDRGVPDFVVIADDPSYKMALGNKARSFTKMSYSDIVSQIGREYGLSVEADATAAQFDYTLQADSDFGFVSELADRVGYDWWVEEKVLKFKKPATSAASARLNASEDLRQFSVRASALHPSSSAVMGWTAKTKTSIKGNSASPSSGILPTASLVSGYASVSALSSMTKVSTSAQGPVDQEEAQDLADRAAAAWAAAAVTARGTTLIAPAIKIGGSVEVEGAGPANGKYFVTEVEHSYTDRGFETRFVAGDHRPNGLVDTLTSTKQTSFRRDGLVVGLVTQIGNSEGSPGDIKVKYPGIDDQLASGWARMVSVGGGNKKGVTFMPEVNDEVIVGFENGDPRRPVILGAVFNGKDSQPAFAVESSMVNSRQITSRLGHAVEFGDGTAPDKQYISLTLAGGATSVMMSKKEFIAQVPAGIPLSITAGSASFKIGNDGSITIQGSKITLKADTDVEISGLNVTTKASVKNSASGAMVEVKGSAQVEVSAGGPAMIKGLPVMVN